MATLRDRQFGIELHDVPTINIRLEFNQLLGVFRNQRFRDQFTVGRKDVPVWIGFAVWLGRRDALLSNVLREAIVGFESAVSGAVLVEALHRHTALRHVLDASKIRCHSANALPSAF